MPAPKPVELEVPTRRPNLRWTRLLALFLAAGVGGCSGEIGPAVDGIGGGPQRDAGPREAGSGDGQDGAPDAAPVADAAADLDASLRPDADAGPIDPIERALATGDPAWLPEDGSRSLLERIRDEAELLRARELAFAETIYDDGAVDYDPGRSSQFFLVRGIGSHLPVAFGSERGLALAVAAELPETRVAAYGTSLIQRLQAGEIADYQAPFRRLLGWLTRRTDAELPDPLSVRLLLHDDGSVHPTTAWFAAQLPDWSVIACTDEASVTTCVAPADLVITASQPKLPEDSVVEALRSAQTEGTPLLYVHQASWNAYPLTASVLNVFELAMEGPGGPGNFFSQDQATWSDAEDMVASASDASALRDLALGFLQGDFGFDVSQCTTDGCAHLESWPRFDRAARRIQEANQGWDHERRRLFDTAGQRLQKLLTLLGDDFREDVDFPLDRQTSSTDAFLRARFADYALLYSRDHNPVPRDLGNFGPTDFGTVQLQDVDVTIVSKPAFRAAGVYVVPGEVVTVTRTDPHASLHTTVFINTQRSGATHEWEANGFNRPKFLRSPSVPIAPGETISLSSPIGGPLQIGFDALDVEARFHVTGVGRHPFWKSSDDDATFAAALEEPVWNWAEVVTPGFEVHSRRDKMLETSSDPRWTDLGALTEAISIYVYDHPHGLAGFSGPGITPLPEVIGFAGEHGLIVQHIDWVKHMNADQATCGYGCSGNPYDAYWAFSPLGHGDLHELGHGLENERFKFAGREGHAHTNFYSYYSKSRYAADTGQPPDCQNVGFRDLFDIVVAAQSTPDPFVTMRDDTSLHTWNPGVALFMQAMLAAQTRGQLNDGWMLVPRLHLLARDFDLARRSDDDWSARREALGFSTFSRAQADGIGRNDWLLVAMSLAAGLDYRPWFETFGLETSSEAQSQVEAFGHPALPGVFYAVDSFCDAFEGPEIAIGPGAVWPD